MVAADASGNEDIAATMAEYARLATEHASEVMGLTLDHTFESLSTVETILAKLHDGLPGSFWRWLGIAPNKKELGIMSEFYGGYVGEIIKGAIGGRWVLPETGPFSGAPSIAFADQISSPVLKVYERLMEPAGSIPAYVGNLKRQWSGASG